MEDLEFGRFSDPAVLILASLAGGEKHGYAMMEDIQATAGVHLGARHPVRGHLPPGTERPDRGHADR